MQFKSETLQGPIIIENETSKHILSRYFKLECRIEIRAKISEYQSICSYESRCFSFSHFKGE
nr:MAG TPA: hypothetical protein [Caudoviricetes sp.]